METAISIRAYKDSDRADLFALYPRAFPDEDLLGLMQDLLASSETFSLIAQSGGSLVGHIGLTACLAPDGNTPTSMLAPLAVEPKHQRQGIGKALIQAGINRARTDGFAKMVVLGDPNYYSRSGFTQERDIAAPRPIPGDWAPAWQSMTLIDGAAFGEGVLRVPAFWDKPDYWT